MATTSNFLDSLGVNTHASFGTGAYTNSSLTVQSLNYLGISSVRDGFSAYGVQNQTLSALADAGIKINVVVGSDVPATGLAKYISALESFATSHAGSLLAVEGLNEANLFSFSYNGSSSMEAAAAFQKAFYTAVNASSVLGDLPVLNMTIGNDNAAAYAALGDLSQYSDYANVHSYFLTYGNGDARQEDQIALAKTVNSTDPLIITETGFTTLKTVDGIGISETGQAKLILNGLFDAWENGAQKTYLYELFDGNSSDTSDAESHFGLFSSDGTPKQAATAIHNLTTILSSGSDSSVSTQDALKYTLSGMPGASHSMVLNKAGGVFDLVLWAEPKIWDDVLNKDIAVASSTVTINLGAVYGKIYVYDPMKGTAPIAVFSNTSKITVALTDHPLIIEVGATAPISTPAITVDPVLTLSADDFVAQIDTLATAQGLQEVKLTGDHVLHVSSEATMRYILAHYQDVLDKVTGGYSFVVENPQETWRTFTYYSAEGAVTSKVEQGLSSGVVTSQSTFYPDGSSYTEVFKNGVVVSASAVSTEGDQTYYTFKDGIKASEIVQHKDGSYDVFEFAITGQAYTTQHQSFNAAGKIVALERDGDHGFHQSWTFDASTGKAITFSQVSVDGTKSYYTYTSTGAAKTTNIIYADGHSEAYDYGITGQSYTTVHQVFNASGKITLLERTGSNGFFENFKFDASTGNVISHNLKTTDGETVNQTYYSDGSAKSAIFYHANGSYDTYDYNITGKTYSTQHQTFNAAGKIVNLVRDSDNGFHQSWKFDASTGKTVAFTQFETDGTQKYTTYTSTGAAKTMNIVHTDGHTEAFDYGITGQAYTTRHQVFDANGKLTLLEHSGNDGFKQTYTFDTTTGRYVTLEQHDTNGTDRFYSYAANGNSKLKIIHDAADTYNITAYVKGLTLDGGVHNDTFTFKSSVAGTVLYEGGNDTVVGFSARSGHIDLADGLVSSLSQVDVHQSGADTIVFIDNAHSLTLKNVAMTSLHDSWLTL